MLVTRTRSGISRGPRVESGVMWMFEMGVTAAIAWSAVSRVAEARFRARPSLPTLSIRRWRGSFSEKQGCELKKLP